MSDDILDGDLIQAAKEAERLSAGFRAFVKIGPKMAELGVIGQKIAGRKVELDNLGKEVDAAKANLEGVRAEIAQAHAALSEHERTIQQKHADADLLIADKHGRADEVILAAQAEAKRILDGAKSEANRLVEDERAAIALRKANIAALDEALQAKKAEVDEAQRNHENIKAEIKRLRDRL